MFKEELIEKYLIWVGASHPKTTVLSYQYALKPLDTWLMQAGYNLLSLTPHSFSEYMLNLQNAGLKGGTRSHYSTTARGLWRWLREQGMVSWSEKMIPIPSREDVESHACLTKEDFEKMLATFNEFFPRDLRDKAIVRMFMLTGARLSEIANELTLSRLDLEHMKVRIKTYKRKGHYREVYWDEETNALLKRWLEARRTILEHAGIPGSDAVFVSLDSKTLGDALKRYGYQRAFKRAREAAGIKRKYTPHSARHGHATLLAQSGMDVYKLKDDMGHANVKNTMIYTHIAREDIQASHKACFSRAFQQT